MSDSLSMKKNNSTLLEDMCINYHEYQLYQWMYLMEKYHKKSFENRNIDNTLLQDILFASNKPYMQMVNFQANISLAASASDIEEIFLDNQRIKAKVNIPLLGNLNGPIDVYYIDYFIRLLRDKDTALVDFLNIFNHQIVCLFYRANMAFLPHANIEQYNAFLYSLSDDQDHNIDFASMIWGGMFDKYAIEKFLLKRFDNKYDITLKEDHAYMINANNMQCKLDKKSYLGEKILGNNIFIHNYGLYVVIEAFNLVDYKKILPNNDMVLKILQSLKQKIAYDMPILVRVEYNSAKQEKKGNILGYDAVLGCANYFNQHIY